MRKAGRYYETEQSLTNAREWIDESNSTAVMVKGLFRDDDATADTESPPELS